MKNINYSEIKIDGLHYVREITNEEGERGGYLLIDNKNKPVKEVYFYLSRKQTMYGDEINTIKRICYDLCYFYDYMLVNNIDVEMFNYEYFYDFVSEYLKKMDPEFKVYDSLERSLLKKIPILAVYKNYYNKNVEVLDENKVGGLSHQSICRIANNAKNFMIFLVNFENRSIDVENIFVETIVKTDKDNHLLGHLQAGRKVIFSVSGILKAAKISIRTNRDPNPISESCIFEDVEIENFFDVLRKDNNIMYYLFFYLLKVTGMRISEARALKIFKTPKLSLDMDFNELESDIRLIDKNENIWEVSIIIRNNNPKDLQIKSHKNRVIHIVDSEKILQNILKQSIIYRILKMKNKKKNHQYLFINRNGNRFLNPRVEQKFNETMNLAGLKERLGRGKLVVHSIRHTYASKWIKELKEKNIDVELNYLSKILGHANSLTTRKTYIHFFKADIIDVLKKIEKVSRIEERKDSNGVS